jgi:CRISPR-associated protein Csm4
MNLETWEVSGGGFHFGLHGLGQEETAVHWSSDRLWAALMSRLAEQRGGNEVQRLAEALRGPQPPVAFSSLMPRAGKVRFFPTPMRPPPENVRGGARPKDIKKLKWLSEGVFRAAVNGARLDDLVADNCKHAGLLMTQKELDSLPRSTKPGEEKMPIERAWAVERRPRVAVSRVERQSQIFHTGRVTFAPGSGLWLAAYWLDETWKPILTAALEDLAVSGLGGDRSGGFGAATLKRGEPLALPEAADGPWVSLSRYLPRSDEMDALMWKHASYTVEQVGGWIDSPQDKNQRRRAVRLLSEGSVLGPVARRTPGDTVDVQPDYNGNKPLSHPVWRCGVALAVGLKEV